MSLAKIFYLLLVSAGLGMLPRTAALHAATPDTPIIRFMNLPAPAPSASVCGLVLVAGDQGPQLLASASPPVCVLAFEAGESADIAVPLRLFTGKISACIEFECAPGAELDTSISVGNKTMQKTLQGSRHTVRQEIEVSVTNSVFSLAFHLKSGTALVRCHPLQLMSGGQSLEIPFFPGQDDTGACPPRKLPSLRAGLEKTLIEWDWRMQDGIGTRREPSSYAKAIRLNLPRIESLVLESARAAMASENHLQRLKRWRDLQTQVLALDSLPESRQEILWREIHELRREFLMANPLFPKTPIVFIKQAPSIFSHQLTQYYGNSARPGGGVFVLEHPGKNMICRESVHLPQGSYQHLEVSADGRKFMFAYCPTPSDPKDREQFNDRFYHLFEAHADGSSLKQLTEGPYDDFSPRYLPDGKLIFISTRRGGFHRCGRGPCPTYTLATADSDGSNPHPISYHETHEWDPSVLNDGSIIYTRWDYVDRHAVYYEQLWTVRPDGTHVRAFYGNNTFNPVGVWEARAVPGSRKIIGTAAAHHAMTAGSIILVDPEKGAEGLAPVRRLTPDALFPESEAPVAQKSGGSWNGSLDNSNQTPKPVESKRWPGHCYRTPFAFSETLILAAYSFDALLGEPDWNRPNMFGLYLVDAFGNKELLYRDFNISSLWAAPLSPSPTAPKIVGTIPGVMPQSKGLFIVQNVNASWFKMPHEEIKALRILQVLPKSTPHANSPALGHANASPGKQVLGTVPVEPDGSACFEAPAGLPLAFQALDRRGQAIQTMRSVTYLQPGETIGCVGCHESRSTAPMPHRSILALKRGPSQISPGPEGSKPLSFPQLVQPVLDQHCVRCHNPNRPDGKVILTGEVQGNYTVAYNMLAARVPYAAWGGKPGDFRIVNSEPATAPDFFGARACGWMQQIIRGKHPETSLDSKSIERLVTWMDANALFYGTFDEADQARQRQGVQIAGPKIE